MVKATSITSIIFASIALVQCAPTGAYNNGMVKRGDPVKAVDIGSVADVVTVSPVSDVVDVLTVNPTLTESEFLAGLGDLKMKRSGENLDGVTGKAGGATNGLPVDGLVAKIIKLVTDLLGGTGNGLPINELTKQLTSLLTNAGAGGATGGAGDVTNGLPVDGLVSKIVKLVTDLLAGGTGGAGADGVTKGLPINSLVEQITGILNGGKTPAASANKKRNIPLVGPLFGSKNTAPATKPVGGNTSKGSPDGSATSSKKDKGDDGDKYGEDEPGSEGSKGDRKGDGDA
ncbi:unnamed protein product [Cunninghamella blakesleeana]